MFSKSMNSLELLSINGKKQTRHMGSKDLKLSALQQKARKTQHSRNLSAVRFSKV
jgi:hypothetical protein